MMMLAGYNNVIQGLSSYSTKADIVRALLKAITWQVSLPRSNFAYQMQRPHPCALLIAIVRPVIKIPSAALCALHLPGLGQAVEEFTDGVIWHHMLKANSIAMAVDLPSTALVQTKEVLDAMLKDAEQPSFKLLRVDGGASQNDLLMQLQADAIQVQFHL